MPDIIKPELTVEEVSEWIGKKEVTVRKMIDHKTMPGVRRYVNRHTEVRIPASEFMIWFDLEIARKEEELKILRTGRENARETVYGKQTKMVHGR